MGKGFQLLFQFLLLTGYQTGIGQLLQLETHIVFLLLRLKSLFTQFFQLSSQRLVTTVLLPVEDQQDIVFGHYIDYFQLKAVIPQQKILVLRMDIDQPAPQFLHHGERDRRIVYKSTRFSRCKQLPAKDANLRIIFQVIREKEFFQFIAGNIEDCFYHTFFRTLLNALSIRTLSQNQGKSTQYNGLSCTRLTGYHRKTFVELNVQAVYQNKVPYE